MCFKIFKRKKITSNGIWSCRTHYAVDERYLDMKQRKRTYKRFFKEIVTGEKRNGKE